MVAKQNNFEKQNLIGVFNSQILLKQSHGLHLGGVKHD